MTNKIRFYSVKGGRAYWTPSPKLREQGFASVRLGPAGPDAEAKAEELTRKALTPPATAADRTPDDYAPGSLNHFFYMWTRTKSFQRKGIRTREEFHTAWLRIHDGLGRLPISKITPDHIEELYDDLDEKHSPKVRHRALAKLRQVMEQAVLRQVIPVNAAAAVRNPSPDPRHQTWLPQERQQLIRGAQQLGMPGMAIAIWIMNETAMSPVDAKSISPAQIMLFGDEAFIDRRRAKTGAGGLWSISADLHAAIDDYIAQRSVTPMADAPILLQDGTNHTWLTSPDFSKAFRKVRLHVFGPAEKRMAMDIRRSVNVEADLAGATPEDRATLLANSLDKDSVLDKTYTPQTLQRARRIRLVCQEGARLKEAG